MADRVKFLVFLSTIAAIFAGATIPKPVEGYDGPSLSRWVAATAWRTMGTEIVNAVATQCSDQGGISIYEAKWQTDCNLVIYKDSEPSWTSDTRQFGYTVCYLAMQMDGNLVIYGERDDDRVAIWSSNSTQHYQDEFYASLNLYGNLGVFTSTHRPIWTSKNTYTSWPSISP